MLHRLIAGAIVVFWAVMTALLIQTRFAPAGSEFMAVPVEHVLRLMMRHGQASELVLVSGAERLGSVGIQPSREGEPKAFALRGNTSVALPMLPRQRVNWETNLFLADDLAPERLEAQVILREPPSVSKFSWLPGERRLDYDLGEAGGKGAIETTPEGLRAFAESLGVDLSFFQGFTAKGSAPQIAARRGQLAIRDQMTEVFVVTVGPQDSPLITAWISQIGQVLRATSAFGYALEADDYGP